MVTDSDRKTETPADGDIVDAEVIAEHGPAEDPGDRAKQVPPPAAAPKPKSFMARAGWILAFGLAAFIGGVAAAPAFEAGLVSLGLRPAPPPVLVQKPDADTAAALADLKAVSARHQEMLAQHEAALAAAEKANAALKADMNAIAAGPGTVAVQAAAPEEVKTLMDRVDSLSADVARLSDLAGKDNASNRDISGAIALARAESAQLKTRLASLETALQSVESGALDASPRGRLVLAIGRIRDRALVGQPFGAELAALRPDFAALPALDQQRIGADLALLEDNGAGIRAFDTLVRDYDDAATDALKARDKADGSFLTGLFTVRRTDAGASGLEGILAQAGRRLDGRDVAGAIETLKPIDGAAAEALAPWLEAAAAHVAVDAAFGRLTAFVARPDNRPDNRTDDRTDEGTGQ